MLSGLQAHYHPNHAKGEDKVSFKKIIVGVDVYLVYRLYIFLFSLAQKEPIGYVRLYISMDE